MSRRTTKQPPADGLEPGRPAKRLTLRRIQDICPWKVFELGREYCDQNRVADLAVQQDGTLAGTILGTDVHYPKDLVDGTFLEYMVERPQKERRAEVSLRTGRRRCSCPYSRVAVCSHVAALLICASKDLRVAVPAGGLPVHGRSGGRIPLPYREDADRILARAADPESAGEDLGGLLELADACRSEGDLAEALMVCLGTSESLLSGLDYPAYSGHFSRFSVLPLGHVPPSAREPEGMDAMRVRKFCEVMDRALRMTSRSRMLYEQKAPCIIALHRLYVETNPWGPSRHYTALLAMLYRTDRDNELLRRLYDQVVPESTPDPKEDPIGFQAVLNLAHSQAIAYEHLKNHSLLASYARRYRDDPGTCVRYVRCLRTMGRDSRAVEAEGRRLFPDFDAWDAPY